ncbi:MAG: hypothetical protein BV457_01955 [Thermoplasmata archaeon M9B1D]|nr:MAG: hypothetical protein BV457_01955 [Thermoplasmata archaeon M9B1D]
MDKKIQQQITFIFLILTLVLFGVSQILPWVTAEVEEIESGSYYIWGSKSEIVISGNSTLKTYIQDFIDTASNRNKYLADHQELIGVSNTSLMSLIILSIGWVISLFVIIFVGLSIKYLYEKKEDRLIQNVNYCMIYSIVTLVIFYVTLTFLLIPAVREAISILGGPNTFSVNLNWSVGFVTFLIGTILVSTIKIMDVYNKFSTNLENKEIESTQTENNKFCRNCGKAISLDDKFCPNCGEKV